MNDTTKHTPGPWFTAGTTVLHGKNSRSLPLRAICSEHGDPYEVTLVWLDSAAGEANARLIAAAPELLAAATQAEKTLRAHYIKGRFTQPQYIYDAIENLARAIAKATGDA
jgi:hypothetical protein